MSELSNYKINKAGGELCGKAPCILLVRPTQIPWLPVLANIAPLALHRRSATDKLLCDIDAHTNWPVHADVFNHPQICLVTRRTTPNIDRHNF